MKTINYIKVQLLFYLKILLFCLILFIAAFLFLKLPSIAQDPHYHRFADSRTLFQISNFFNTASARHASDRFANGTLRNSASGGFARVNAAPFPSRCAR